MCCGKRTSGSSNNSAQNAQTATSEEQIKQQANRRRVTGPQTTASAELAKQKTKIIVREIGSKVIR